MVTSDIDHPSESTPFAGFWWRFWAAGMDLTFIFLPISVLSFVADEWFPEIGTDELAHTTVGEIFWPITELIVAWLYFAIFESSGWRATPGKRWVNIEVCDLEGGRLSFTRASGRFLAKFLSVITFGLGFLITAFTKRKQSLHDFLSNTLVIRRGAQLGKTVEEAA